MTAFRKTIARYSVFHGTVSVFKARNSVGHVHGNWEGPGTYEFHMETVRMSTDGCRNWTAIPVAVVMKVNPKCK